MATAVHHNFKTFPTYLIIYLGVPTYFCRFFLNRPRIFVRYRDIKVRSHCDSHSRRVLFFFPLSFVCLSPKARGLATKIGAGSFQSSYQFQDYRTSIRYIVIEFFQTTICCTCQSLLSYLLAFLLLLLYHLVFLIRLFELLM